MHANVALALMISLDSVVDFCHERHVHAGLTEMLNTGASVQRFSCGAAAGTNGSQQGIHASSFVRGCGRLLLYSTCAPTSCTVDGASVDFEFDAKHNLLSLNVPRNDSLLSAVSLDFALAS